VRGRIRVRLPKAKRDRATLDKVQRTISAMHGVKGVDVNHATGSVVVQYDTNVHEDFHAALTRHGEEHDLFRIAPPHLSEVDELAETIEKEAEFLAQRSDIARAIVDFVKGINSDLKKATNNSVDLQVLLPLGLAGFAFFGLEPDMTTPLWVTLGIFSFNSFVSLHHPVTTTTEVEHEEVIRSPAPRQRTTAIRKRVTKKRGE
jgi:cation transport ATPase